MRWKNRIVGHGVLPAGQFLANDRNWRIHPKQQQEALSGVLSDVGWVQQVIVNKRTSPQWGADQNVETLIDGHLRVTMALRQGEEVEVPVLYVDLTPGEEAEVLATLDPISALAVPDKEKLAELLRDVSSGCAAVQEMLSALCAISAENMGGDDSIVSIEDPAISVKMSFHLDIWLDKREELVAILDKIRKTYDCEIKIDE